MNHHHLLADLKYTVEKLEDLRKLPGVEECISAEDKEELERIWADLKPKEIEPS